LNEPMDTDNDRDVYDSPEKMNERSARQDDSEDDPIMGVIMGANDNSYLVKGGGKFEVLRNVRGVPHPSPQIPARDHTMRPPFRRWSVLVWRTRTSRSH